MKAATVTAPRLPPFRAPLVFGILLALFVARRVIKGKEEALGPRRSAA